MNKLPEPTLVPVVDMILIGTAISLIECNGDMPVVLQAANKDEAKLAYQRLRGWLESDRAQKAASPVSGRT